MSEQKPWQKVMPNTQENKSAIAEYVVDPRYRVVSQGNKSYITDLSHPDLKQKTKVDAKKSAAKRSVQKIPAWIAQVEARAVKKHESVDKWLQKQKDAIKAKEEKYKELLA